MSPTPVNPFLEGSQPVPDEEVTAAAKALAEEAASKRAKTSEIKQRAEESRTRKEAARKAEIARMEAEIEATRAQLVKTVASIPRTSGKSTLRPAPPPNLETTGADSSVTSDKSFSSYNSVSVLELISDIVLAAIAVAFTTLIFYKL